jgi:hypothetical protein
MDNPADTPDQADEEILTYTASDEALEAEAEGAVPTIHFLCSSPIWSACRPEPQRLRREQTVNPSPYRIL